MKNYSHVTNYSNQNKIKSFVTVFVLWGISFSEEVLIPELSWCSLHILKDKV